jgi:hypothetical protein
MSCSSIVLFWSFETAQLAEYFNDRILKVDIVEHVEHDKLKLSLFFTIKFSIKLV